MNTKRMAIALNAALLWFLMLVVTPARAIVISLTNEAGTLQDALVQSNSGIAIQSLSVVSPGSPSLGTFTNTSGTYGIPGGIAMSTGDLRNYGDSAQQSVEGDFHFDVAATAAQNANLSPITGWPTHFDTTHIDVVFDMQSGYDTVHLLVVFGSEEFPDFVGGAYSDGFGAYINGTNVALVNGLPVNVNHPNLADVPGTILNGILTNTAGQPGPYVHKFEAFVGDGSTGNILRLILGDAGDSSLDSTVYIAQLSGIASTPPPIPGDFDGDGDVDGADFVVWQTNFPTQTGATLATGDADGDGDVDGADFVIWQTNFPFTPSPAAAVPEPATCWLALLAAVAMLAARRTA